MENEMDEGMRSWRRFWTNQESWILSSVVILKIYLAQLLKQGLKLLKRLLKKNKTNVVFVRKIYQQATSAFF